ncbi:MAG TPA: CHASE domain-containing protein [Thermoanaerobaculia bacterium]
MAISTGADTRASSPATSKFSRRRLRSAFQLWRGSVRRTDLLICSIFLALSLGLGAYVYARAHAAARLEFARQAQVLQAAITKSLDDPLEDLSALQSFLQAYGSVSRKQFHLSTEPLLGKHKHVYAFEWLPVVREGERGTLEAEAKSAGLSTYRFWESGPDGTPRAAGRRGLYVPIHYMEPPNSLALGLDISASSDRWETAVKARDSGVAAASAPFRLIEDAGRQDASAAVAVYSPVYVERDPGSEAARRASLFGFVSAIFRVGPLVSRAVSSSAENARDVSGLGYSLRDVEEPGSPTLAERPPNAGGVPRRPGFELAAMPVLFGDRHWNLDVFALPGAFPTPRRPAILATLAGVLFSVLGLVIHTSLRTIIRLRRQMDRVGPYRLVARLGQGAMGVVWEARHALLRRPTAIKLLAPGTGGDRALARFEREVQLTATLTHPSTIAIYDYGHTGEGVFYYAMELLQGINLLQLVTFDGPTTPGRVVHLMRQACGALAEAHAAGLIHRDIKPANLMVCVYGGIPDFLKVLDFGLVKDLGAAPIADHSAVSPENPNDAALSQDGSLLGTPLYMAPEGMTDPGKIDVRADIFALGAVGYFLLTGASPFPGRTAIEVFQRERQGPPRPLAQAAKHPVPPALEAAILACLSLKKEDRPATAEALDDILEKCCVQPAWTRESARAWWRERGPAALEAARAERREGGRFLVVSPPEDTDAEASTG